MIRLVNLLRPGRAEPDLARELDAHLALVADDLERRGMMPDAARLAARRTLGGVERTKDLHRDARSFAWLDDARQDVRYGARALRRSPGFAAVAIAILAVGIGVNATVFTVTNATLFKAFPLVHRNDRLLYMTSGRGCCVSYPDFEDWRAQAKSFDGMAIVHGVQRTVSDAGGLPEQYEATEVSADTFRVAGQMPMLGRDFVSSDEMPGAPPVAILSYGFWDRRYNKASDIVGQRVRIGGVPTNVIGVMPRGFSFPQKVDLWVPLVPTPEVRQRGNRETWFVFGRLAEGVTTEAARAEMATIGRRLAIAYPDTDRESPPIVSTFDEFFIGPTATLTYQAMWGAVGFVLLIACANLANLLLARSAERSREISVRMALGAGRWRNRPATPRRERDAVERRRVPRLVARRAGRASISARRDSGGHLDQISGGWFDNVLDYSMDGRVLAYLIAISIATGLLFGLAPAGRLWRLDVNATLKDGGHGAPGGRRGHLSRFLVTAELALAIVLLAGAGVMIRSFLNVRQADLGVRADNILTALVSLPSARYPNAAAQTSFFGRLEAGVRGLPGVESAALASQIPGWRARPLPYEAAGSVQPPASNDARRQTVPRLSVSPAYFRTLGASLVSGRDFRESDGAAGSEVAIVNRMFASRQWPGEDPIGKRLRLFDGNVAGPWLSIVGVVSNIVQNDPTRQEFDPLVYSAVPAAARREHVGDRAIGCSSGQPRHGRSPGGARARRRAADFGRAGLPRAAAGASESVPGLHSRVVCDLRRHRAPARLGRPVRGGRAFR